MEPKNFSLDALVVRVEHLCDVLRNHLFADCAVVVTDVESIEIERFDRLSLPQAEEIYRIYTVAWNRRVVGYSQNHSIWRPLDAISAGVVLICASRSAEADSKSNLGPRDFPWIA